MPSMAPARNESSYVLNQVSIKEKHGIDTVMKLRADSLVHIDHHLSF